MTQNKHFPDRPPGEQALVVIDVWDEVLGKRKLGVGVLISSDGVLLTNSHVIERTQQENWRGTVTFGFVYCHPEKYIIAPRFAETGGTVTRAWRLISDMPEADTALVQVVLASYVPSVPFVEPHMAYLGDAEPLPPVATPVTVSGIYCREYLKDPNQRDSMVVRTVQTEIAPPQYSVGCRPNGDIVRAPWRPPNGIVPVNLFLREHETLSPGYSGGPVMLDEWLIGIYAAGSERPGHVSVHAAVPMARISTALGVGDPEFQSPNGYRLPEDRLAVYRQGQEDPLLDQKVMALIDLLPVGEPNPETVAEVMGWLHYYAEENSSAADAFEQFRTLVDEPNPYQELMQAAFSFFDPIQDKLLIADTRSDSSQDGVREFGDVQCLIGTLHHYFWEDPTFILMRHASRSHAVVLRVDAWPDDLRPAIVRRVLESIGDVAVQFCEENAVWTGSGRYRDVLQGSYKNVLTSEGHAID